MAVHYRMYDTTMIETKKQNCIDRCTKGVAKYPRLCMMFVHSRIILITFIDLKKKILQNYDTVSIDFHFVLKPYIKQFDVQCLLFLNLVII